MASSKRINVPWLLAPKWKDLPMTKGLYHHRTPMGIILAADEDLIVTLGTGNLEQVQIRLLNNDSNAEKTFIVDKNLPGRAAILSTDTITVPFVDCHYLDELPLEYPSITVEYPKHSKCLPIYRLGDNEENFFQLWDLEEAEFAYIEGKYFCLLVPDMDKKYARDLPDGKCLDDLITFFDEVFTIYCELLGLSFEDTGLNKNVRNRFFIKADKNGSGAAYYCDWWTAETSASVKEFWLNPNPNCWGALHEIAHGHEWRALSDETLSVKEVWNNILVVFYQYNMMGDEVRTKGGLARGVTEIDTELKRGEPVKEWGLFQKLSFLMHMFIKAGQKSFSRFNQLTRQECAGIPYYASGTTCLEKLMHLFSIDFGLDMYPFMRLANGMISDEQLVFHYYSFSEVAYPLNALISDESQLKSVKEKLNLWYDTSLVTPMDLRITKLRGDFTLKINEHVFSIIFGEIFKLMDGSRTIIEKRVFSRNIILNNIPIGVYKVFIPSCSFTNKYVYNDVYAVIKADEMYELNLSVRKVDICSILFDKIKFLGLAEDHFASLSVDPFKHALLFHYFSDNPHTYFEGQTYSSVTVKNGKNEVIFEKVIEGVDSSLGWYEIPIYEPLQVEIYHAEPKNRLKTEDPIMDFIIDHESVTNSLVVSEFGFYNKNTHKMQSPTRLLKRIDNVASKIRCLHYVHEREHCHPKYSLFLAIETFKYLFSRHKICANLDEQYKDCLPPKYTSDIVNALTDKEIASTAEAPFENDFFEITQTETGKKILLCTKYEKCPLLFGCIKFLGLADKHFATLSVDARNSVINLDIFLDDPHYYFRQEVYYSVRIRDRNGDEIFSKVIEGIDATIGKFSISFSQDVEIEIFHAEPKNRLQTENPVIGYVIDYNSKVNTLKIHKQDIDRNQVTNNRLIKTSLKRTKRALKKSASVEILYNEISCE